MKHATYARHCILPSCPISHAGYASDSKRHCSHRPRCEGYPLGARHWGGGQRLFSRSPQLSGRTNMNSSNDQPVGDLCYRSCLPRATGTQKRLISVWRAVKRVRLRDASQRTSG